MRKELVKEVAFGKATARITVKMEETEKRVEGFEGLDLGTKIDTRTKIEIVAPNGKVVTKGSVATATGYNKVFADRFESGRYSKDKEITIVGKATTEGREIADEINRNIDEMKEELAHEFGVKTEKEINHEEEKKEAKNIVKLAEKEGIENLKTNDQLKKWMKEYNDFNNEGGEGYIPERVSKEQYEQALKTLE